MTGDPPRARGNPTAGRCRGSVPTGPMKKCAIPPRPRVRAGSQRTVCPRHGGTKPWLRHGPKRRPARRDQGRSTERPPATGATTDSAEMSALAQDVAVPAPAWDSAERAPRLRSACRLSWGYRCRAGWVARCGGRLLGIVGHSVRSWRVEVESSIGSHVEYVVEAVAGGEIKGGVRFVGQSGLGVAGRTELGGDAPAGEHRVPGGARSG